MVKHLLTLRDLAADDLSAMLALAEADPAPVLAGKGAALYFEKPSARTRNSMELAVHQLGGHPVYLTPAELGISTRESVEDIARTLACYHGVIAARVFDHGVLEQLAAASPVPVVNLLSGTDHPLQGLADLLTIRQLMGRIEGVKVAYVGDGDNNVARSLAQGCAALGAELTIVAPEGYQLSDAPAGVAQTADLGAVAGADIVYSDVFVSMGQDGEAERRMADLAAYQVDEALMARTPDAWFLHCLPARRGEEVTAGVIDGPRSAVWRQAENRMHSARGALMWLLQQD
ncbi:ornithine carbamoyltransferase [Sphingomonas astaxanthinifaciens DSM 22298]|uniref:Ornithine carbamoyltransferase n=1 Tax=Sphingomonas astaxanthinifaciens DSM 22298 TaxID=1123267 RepID=A0ABQ5Z2G2_9SPHN|nr:ornithine carbamoyltransferase [Sphingomonas astaxanthinifaciens DSM 22298]